MKKIFSILIISIIFLSFASAWDTCDSGCTEDTAKCGAYIDTNSDGFCDHGQKEPNYTTTQESLLSITDNTHDLITGKELKSKTVKEISELYEIPADIYVKELSKELNVKVSVNQLFQTLHDNYDLEPSIAKEIALELKQKISPELQKATKKIQYHPIEILLIILILYGFTYFLSKKNKISLVNHRKIWNIVLLISFTITAILGFLTTTYITNGWPSWNIRGLHVDPGVVFVVVGFLHTFWHIPYLKRIFNFKK